MCVVWTGLECWGLVLSSIICLALISLRILSFACVLIKAQSMFYIVLPTWYNDCRIQGHPYLLSTGKYTPLHPLFIGRPEVRVGCFPLQLREGLSMNWVYQLSSEVQRFTPFHTLSTRVTGMCCRSNFLCGCWGSDLRSSFLSSKHCIDWSFPLVYRLSSGFLKCALSFVYTQLFLHIVKWKRELAWWLTLIIPSLDRLRQEDCF